jgi:hypothetical protein
VDDGGRWVHAHPPDRAVCFDASALTKELYNSTQAPAKRDVAGPSSKFLVPMVANGHVDVGTQTELDVYGEL